MRWLLSLTMMCLLLSGCTASKCTPSDTWNYDAVFTLQLDADREPPKLDALAIHTCFLPQGSTTRICAEQTAPGELTLQGEALDPAQVILSASTSSVAHQVTVRWRWQTPVWLHNGDRYRVSIRTSAGDTLYEGEVAVDYRNITEIEEDDVGEFNTSCETQTVASATLI